MRVLITLLLILFVNTSNLHAGLMDSFVDPVDGKLDASNWLLQQGGFLPIPLVVTEPALGAGGGLGLVFFHESEEAREERLQGLMDPNKPVRLPPSISAVFGAATENKTWMAGAFHWATLKRDRIRYTGALARVSVNLKYYGNNQAPLFANGLKYNMDGWFLLQAVEFRIDRSPVFLGGELTWFDSKNSFDLGDNILGISNWEYSSQDLGLSLIGRYDSRDNIFTPNRGLNLLVKPSIHSGESIFGYEYVQLKVDSKKFWQAGEDAVVGWRVKTEFSGGDLPFYSKPFVDLRGIPIMRYQGDHVISTEAEVRYNLDPRWAVIAFAGLGRESDALGSFGSANNRWAGGGGFRYLGARRLGFYAGVDVARGPEDWAIYLTTGHHWR